MARAKKTWAEKLATDHGAAGSYREPICSRTPLVLVRVCK
jgi:hypothetical protein